MTESVAPSRYGVVLRGMFVFKCANLVFGVVFCLFIFKHRNFQTLQNPEIDAPACQILRCPQCAVLLASTDEFWSHLRAQHYSILYSNACKPLLTPES